MNTYNNVKNDDNNDNKNNSSNNKLKKVRNRKVEVEVESTPSKHFSKYSPSYNLLCF